MRCASLLAFPKMPLFTSGKAFAWPL